MAVPEIDNTTRLELSPAFMADEEARPLFVPIVQATFDIAGTSDLALADEQQPVKLGGEIWEETDDEPCYKLEPQIAFWKPATDVALIGHARPRRAGDRERIVGLRVGPLQKRVRVVGDRYWVKRFGRIRPGKARPFDEIPLSYDRAFGGSDRTHESPKKHRSEDRNPIGVGFRCRRSPFEEGIPLPNLEDPEHPLKSWGATPPPAGFGFISPGWKPRSDFAGTYDEAWQAERMPRLPSDFDRRFFSAATPDLLAARYLRGDEPVLVQNLSSRGDLSFRLPGLPAPLCTAAYGRTRRPIQMNLDTVVIDVDEHRVLLLWRGSEVLRGGPQDVSEVALSIEHSELQVH